MAQVPKYPFRVITTKHLGDRLTTEQKNYETLPAAMSWRDIVLGKARVKKVEIVMVIDESTPSHRDPLELVRAAVNDH